MISKRLEKQVLREHYFNKSYLNQARFICLQKQLELCQEFDRDNSFLEIGPGAGLFICLMREFGFKIFSMDFAEDLSADILGALPRLPLKSKSFDVVCAFEVLEHLPFEQFDSCLTDLVRVARKKVIFSVPDQRDISLRNIQFSLTLGSRKINRRIWRQPLGKLTNPKEHYWELGFNVRTDDILRSCQIPGIESVNEFFVSPYFHFFQISLE